MKSEYKRYTKCGVGGMTCPCCGGKGKTKKLEKRISKKLFKRAKDKDVETQSPT